MDVFAGITSAIALGISIILLLAALGWVKQGKGETKTQGYLLALLAVICFQLLELIYHSFQLHVRWPIFIKLIDPLVVLAPFLLFAYISGLKGQAVKMKGIGLLHFFPVIYVLAWDLPFWFLPAQDKILYMNTGVLDSEPWTVFVPYRSDYLLILASLSLFYWWRIKALMPAKTGPLSRVDNLIQRTRQAMLLLAIWMVACAVSGYGSSTNMILSIGAGILVGYLCYFFLLQARLPRIGKLEVESLSEPKNNVNNLLAISNIPSSVEIKQDNDLFCVYKILQEQLSQGLFESSDLSLVKLSEASGVNIHLASKAINECSGGNFSDWVNLYRVEKAKSLLIETNTQVSRICYEVGFNSKSTFYSAFKKMTGLTPAVYRKQMVSS